MPSLLIAAPALRPRQQHDDLPLKEEKALVAAISKLGMSRERVRALDAQRAAVADLEGEAGRLRAVIGELESEFNVVKGERKQAQGIVAEVTGRLVVVEGALKEIDAEMAELEGTKGELQRSLDEARGEGGAPSAEWRENRKHSVRVRELVAAGSLSEAKALCDAQIAAVMAKLRGDAGYRAEYCRAWREQRRTPISPLLPHTGPADASASSGDVARLRGGAGPGGRKPPPVPQGEAKAKALIAAALSEAAAAAGGRRAAAAAPDGAPASAPAGKYQPPGRGAPIVGDSGPSAPVRPAKPADLSKLLASLPTVAYDEGFVPASRAFAAAPAASAEEQAARVREENRRKMEEAEARKARNAEKKRARAAAAKAAPAPAAPAAPALPAARAPAPRAASPEASDGDAGGSGADAAVVVRNASAAAKPRAGKAPKVSAVTARSGTAARRAPPRPKGWRERVSRMLPKAMHKYSTAIVVIVLALLVLGIVYLSLGRTSGRGTKAAARAAATAAARAAGRAAGATHA